MNLFLRININTLRDQVNQKKNYKQLYSKKFKLLLKLKAYLSIFQLNETLKKVVMQKPQKIKMTDSSLSSN